MADTAPQVKVPRAKLYKMISYKGKSGGVKKYTPLTAADQVGKMESDIGNGFKALTAGLNSGLELRHNAPVIFPALKAL